MKHFEMDLLDDDMVPVHYELHIVSTKLQDNNRILSWIERYQKDLNVFSLTYDMTENNLLACKIQVFHNH